MCLYKDCMDVKCFIAHTLQQKRLTPFLALLVKYSVEIDDVYNLDGLQPSFILLQVASVKHSCLVHMFFSFHSMSNDCGDAAVESGYSALCFCYQKYLWTLSCCFLCWPGVWKKWDYYHSSCKCFVLPVDTYLRIFTALEVSPRLHQVKSLKDSAGTAF